MDDDEGKEKAQKGGDNVDNTTDPIEEVHRYQPPPNPRGEQPPSQEPTLDRGQIIINTLDIITTYLKKINDQKHFLASMGFMMHSLQNLLISSQQHEERINAYLVNDEQLQAQWFLMYHKILPPYGDYSLVLKDDPGLVSVDQMPNPIKQSLLKDITVDVVNNMYAGGLQVKAHRTLDQKVYKRMKDLKEVTNKEAFPFYSWLFLTAKEVGHEETLEAKFFEVSSFLDFLDHSS